MAFVKFLVQLCPALLLVAIAASLVGGLSTVALLAYTMSLLKSGAAGLYPWPLIFVGLCLAFVLGRAAASISITHIDNKVVPELRARLARKVVSTPLRALETIGTARILTALTSDVSTISSALPRLVSIITSAAIMIGCLIYMSTISVAVTALVIPIVAAGASLYALIGLGSRSRFVGAARAWDRLAENLEGLILGIKQLKINARRRTSCVDGELPENQRTFQTLRMSGFLINSVAIGWAQTSFAIVLGTLLLVFGIDGKPAAANAIEFAFVFVLLMGPLEALMLTTGSLRDAAIAFERLHALGLAFPAAALGTIPEGSTDSIDWRQLELRGIHYTYNDDKAFQVGPIDLVLNRKQVVFIRGGNGSGKSTFAKLLTSLYAPDGGQIFFDDKPIDGASLSWYRRQFSVLFEDSYQFNRLADADGASEETARACLRAWGLKENLSQSTELSRAAKGLSFGQRRRLALVSALLEDRPIYVLDEWAAQQDEDSRHAFYTRLLPSLKDSGKLVLVITHDVGYDDIADRILRFQDGKIASEFSRLAA